MSKAEKLYKNIKVSPVNGDSRYADNSGIATPTTTKKVKQKIKKPTKAMKVKEIFDNYFGGTSD